MPETISSIVLEDLEPIGAPTAEVEASAASPPEAFYLSPEEVEALENVGSCAAEFALLVLERRNTSVAYERSCEASPPTDCAQHLVRLREFFPEPTLYRDDLVNEILNKHYTEWSDIDEARQYLSEGSATEAQVERLEASIASIPVEMKGLLYIALMGLVNEESSTDVAASLPTTLPPAANEALSEFTTVYAAVTTAERFNLASAILLGKGGVFSDERFEDYGRLFVREVVSSVYKVTSGEGHIPQQVYELGDAAAEFFARIPEGRRVKILTAFADKCFQTDGAMSVEKAATAGLEAFGVLGAKLGQMDLFVPEGFRDAAAALKEDVTPLSKFTVVQEVEDLFGMEARKRYVGFGPSLHAGSTASVLAGRSRSSVGYDKIIKCVRPEIRSTVEDDLEALQSALEVLLPALGVEADVTAIINELGVMIKEEIRPANEAAASYVMSRGKAEQGEGAISHPRVSRTGTNLLEMDIAPGVSLSNLERAYLDGKRKCEGVSLADVSIPEIHKEVVGDFFRTAFTEGIFHTDLHQGNIFVTETGEVTEIDLGQVGTASKAQRRELFRLTFGLYAEDVALTTESVASFMPETDRETIREFLEKGLEEGANMVKTATALISSHPCDGTVVRYMKGLATVLPYMDSMTPAEKSRTLLPYLVKHGPITGPVRNATTLVRKRREETQNSAALSKFAPKKV